MKNYFVITIDTVEKEDYEEIRRLIGTMKVPHKRVRYYQKKDELEIFLCKMTWKQAIEVTDILLHMTDLDAVLHVL